MLPPLVNSLLGLPVDVVPDPEPESRLPNPWRTYRAALERTPPWATHRLVLQDDVTVIDGFPHVAAAALTARPDALVAFYVGGLPYWHASAVRQAGERGDSWALLATDRWQSAVALTWPARTIHPFLEYVEAQGWPADFRADDEIIGRWVRHAGEQPLATVPCLVQHEDVVESLIGLRAAAGRDTARVAACWNPACDHGGIDWTLGP